MFKLLRTSCPGITNINVNTLTTYNVKASYFNKSENDIEKKNVTLSEKKDIKKNSNDDNNAEFLWVLMTANPENIRVMKKNIKKHESSQKIGKIIPIERGAHSIKSDSDNDNNVITTRKNDVTNDIVSIRNPPNSHHQNFNVDRWDSPKPSQIPLTKQNFYSLPHVNTILEKSLSNMKKLKVERWKENMVSKLGITGYKNYKQEKYHDTIRMHNLVYDILKKEPFEVPSDMQGFYQSIKSVLINIKNVQYIRSTVFHPTLGYKGEIDCVAEYKGKRCLIQWARSSKPRYPTLLYDAPLKISACIGAFNADKNYPFMIEMGLLVLAYNNGSPSAAFRMQTAQLNFYWIEWLKKLNRYKTISDQI